MKAVFAGSFDPITLGHLDLIRRALKVVDTLVIAIMHNPDKPGFFTPAQRAALVEQACREAGLTRFQVVTSQDLLVNLAEELGCTLLVRGLRNCQDLESERAMALANAQLSPGLETLFLVAGMEQAGISSSLIRQIAALGGDVSHFVPGCVSQALKEAYSKSNH